MDRPSAAVRSASPGPSLVALKWGSALALATPAAYCRCYLHARGAMAHVPRLRSARPASGLCFRAPISLRGSREHLLESLDRHHALAGHALLHSYEMSIRNGLVGRADRKHDEGVVAGLGERGEALGSRLRKAERLKNILQLLVGRHRSVLMHR